MAESFCEKKLKKVIWRVKNPKKPKKCQKPKNYLRNY